MITLKELQETIRSTTFKQRIKKLMRIILC